MNNIYKEAWLAQSMYEYSQKRNVGKVAAKAGKSRGKILSFDVKDAAAKQKAQGIILKGAHEAFKYAAKSQITGGVGAAIRVTGRIGIRAVPVVGAAMLAYDLYKLGKYVMD